jgi:hypothetical protein
MDKLERGSGAGSGKEFSRLPAERMDRLELVLGWIWHGILEAACEEDGQAGTGSGIACEEDGQAGTGFGIACGEDGQAGSGPGIGFGKKNLRLPAERMDRLELALELDLVRNSRGCLRRGWTGWNWLWSVLWERILEAARGEDGQAGIGFGTKSGKEFSRLPAERMDRLERGSGAGSGKEFSRLPAESMDRLALALELHLGRNSRGCLRRGWPGWNWLGIWSW